MLEMNEMVDIPLNETAAPKVNSDLEAQVADCKNPKRGDKTTNILAFFLRLR